MRKLLHTRHVVVQHSRLYVLRFFSADCWLLALLLARRVGISNILLILLFTFNLDFLASLLLWLLFLILVLLVHALFLQQLLDSVVLLLLIQLLLLELKLLLVGLCAKLFLVLAVEGFDTFQ